MEKLIRLINENKVLVIGKTRCKYCDVAKSILDKYPSIDYKTINLDEVDDRQGMIDALFTLTERKTVPCIFINGVCIGGSDNLALLDKQNKLPFN